MKTRANVRLSLDSLYLSLHLPPEMRGQEDEIAKKVLTLLPNKFNQTSSKFLNPWCVFFLGGGGINTHSYFRVVSDTQFLVLPENNALALAWFAFSLEQVPLKTKALTGPPLFPAPRHTNCSRFHALVYLYACQNREKDLGGSGVSYPECTGVF